MPEETEVMTESTEPVDNLEASDHIEVDEGPAQAVTKIQITT